MAIQWNEARYRFVTQAKTGPVGRDLAKKARVMQSVARVITTTEKHVRTGRYRSSIGAQVVNEGAGLVILFGSNVKYARILEHGSPPHIIPGNPLLWWNMPNDRGWLVRPGLDFSDEGYPVRLVQHPGQREGYHILERAMRRAMKGAILIAA